MSCRRVLNEGQCQIINQTWNCFVLHINCINYSLYSWMDNGQGFPFLPLLHIIQWLSYIPQQLVNMFVMQKSEDSWGKCCRQWQTSWAYSNIQTAQTTQHWGDYSAVWGVNRKNRSGCYLWSGEENISYVRSHLFLLDEGVIDNSGRSIDLSLV